MSGTPARRRAPPARFVLAATLFVLSVLFTVWFHDDRHRLATLLVFSLPPLVMIPGVLAGGRRSPFWAGVFGLFWFSHGVMVAYSQPANAMHGWIELVLALIAIVAANWPGLTARRRARADGTAVPPASADAHRNAPDAPVARDD